MYLGVLSMWGMPYHFIDPMNLGVLSYVGPALSFYRSHAFKCAEYVGLPYNFIHPYI